MMDKSQVFELKIKNMLILFKIQFVKWKQQFSSVVSNVADKEIAANVDIDDKYDDDDWLLKQNSSWSSS